MRAVDIIIKKRDGGSLLREEIDFLIKGYIENRIPDYQLSSFLMAVFFRGMGRRETADLTELMMQSGKIIDLGPSGFLRIDKHSTGGVGDKISLVLAPLAAACGLSVPMMAGRGLGHTGGTLDKLEAIPGYRTSLTEKEFVQALKKDGFSIIGQSDEVVPADKRLYALRDVTGTVESVPLITASILSKKCAEGADGFVFDVKCGSGAFMKNLEEAEVLARSLVDIGTELGRKVKAVITAMDYPLGRMVGNFLEVKEVISCLKGEGPDDIMTLTYRLTAWMLVLAGMVSSVEEGEALCRERITDGSAWNKFLCNVASQGGDVCYVEEPERGPVACFSRELTAVEGGYVARLDAYKIGLGAGLLGAGRARKEDPVSPGAGIELIALPGGKVEKGAPLCRLFADTEELFPEAEKLVREAYLIGEEPAPCGKLILKEI